MRLDDRSLMTSYDTIITGSASSRKLKGTISLNTKSLFIRGETRLVLSHDLANIVGRKERSRCHPMYTESKQASLNSTK